MPENHYEPAHFKILFCAEDRNIHPFMDGYLSDLACKLTHCYNLPEAIAFLQAGYLDLFLLDLHLRDKGEELSALPALLEVQPDLYIIIVSEDFSGKLVLKALSLGAKDYLSKDELATLLKPKIKSLISNQKYQKSFDEKMFDEEFKILKSAYQKNNRNISKTARALGLDRSNLHKKLLEYAIHKPKISTK